MIRPVTDAAVSALLRDRPPWASRIILAGVRGSDAHGTKLPPDHPRATDDTDTFGISAQDLDWYLGLPGYSNHARQSWDTAGDHYDHLIHDVRKTFSLLLKGNPNVHCWLWADPGDVVVPTRAGQLILEHRRSFLSRHCFAALVGYAKAQLHKMERKQYAGYMGAKRKRLVDEIGYDVKHAAHCVRLLHMGIELAQEGEMRTRRPEEEVAVLMEIKAGEWPFRRTEKLAQDLFSKFRSAEAVSDLPVEPDREAAGDLLVRVIKEAYAETRIREIMG